VNAGDTAKLIGIPPNVRDDEQFKTRALFEKCLGQSFVIAAVESFAGVPFPLGENRLSVISLENTLGNTPSGSSVNTWKSRIVKAGF